MQVNRGLVFWGVALVTAGAVALGIQANVLDADAARDVWRLWPVVLIVIGLVVISARTPFGLVMALIGGLVVGGMGGTLVAGLPDGMSIGCGGDLDESLSADGDLSDGADVELDLNCGTLQVDAADGDGWSLSARHATGAEPQVTTAGGGLRVEAEGGGMPFSDHRQAWDVGLPRDAELLLDVSANAASSRLMLADMRLGSLALDANAGEVVIDLAGATVPELELSTNAGSLSITVDEATELDGRVEMNAGSLELCADSNASVAITIPDGNITFSHNLDDRGLDQSGDTWTLGTGTPTVTLEVEGNAASFTLNPDGGCS